MRHMGIHTAGLLFLLLVDFTNTPDAHQKASDNINKVDANILRLISDVDPELISKDLFYLAKDPLPHRKLNMTLPGREKNTLSIAQTSVVGMPLWARLFQPYTH